MIERYRRVIVDIPLEAPADAIEALEDAIVDAAYNAQPDVRTNWDIFCYSYIAEEEFDE